MIYEGNLFYLFSELYLCKKKIKIHKIFVCFYFLWKSYIFVQKNRDMYQSTENLLWIA